MNGSPPQLFSTLMILKAACLHNHCYIDRLITTFMKVLTKMAREHLAPTTTDTNSGNTWATSCENLFLPYANNKGADQPAHLRSLISTFVIRCLDSIIPVVSICKISSLYLVSIAEQANLSLTWSQTPKTGFLVTRLTWKVTDKMGIW